MDENDLEDKCLNLLDKSAEDALNSEAFTKLSLSTVEKILTRDTLSIDEMDVYKACLRWAEEECMRQDVEVINFLYLPVSRFKVTCVADLMLEFEVELHSRKNSSLRHFKEKF